MRKVGLVAVAAALSLAAIGGWAASGRQARLDAPKDVRIDPSQLMTYAETLPEQQVVNFSVVFE
jgi:hypothetical protein